MGALDGSSLIAFVPTTNLPRARAFYAETLGLRVTDESPFACVFDANGTTLRLTPVRKLSRTRYTVLGWRVDDIASTSQRSEPRVLPSFVTAEWILTRRGSGRLPAVTMWRGSRTLTATCCR